MKFFYQIIDSCKNIVSVKYKRLEIAKKSDRHCRIRQKQVKYSQSWLKMTKKLQNSNFWVNLIRKTKTSLQFTQLQLKDVADALKRPVDAIVGPLRTPK